MANEVTIGILLTGTDLLPGKIHSKEIAEVIESVEDMVASMVIRDHPNLKRETVVVGLKSIWQGSIGLEFSPNLTDLTLPAAHRIIRSIAENSFDLLPSGTIDSLRKLSAFTRRYRCHAELSTQNGKLKALAVLTPETRIPEIHPFSGETVIYGEITRVGGAKPKIQFKTLDGQIVYCSTSRAVARKAGSKLYTRVGLRGLAEWNSETSEIKNFHVIDISSYKKISPSQAFEELANLVGDSFNDMKDVDGFVSRMRHELPGE